VLSVRVLILTQLRKRPKQHWPYGFASRTVSPLVGWPTALVNDRSLIAQLELQPHPEGGWYRELHRSTQTISRSDGEARSALTTILFLLHAGEISSWHRVSAADETWHFAGGDPLELLTLPPAGGEVRRQWLGPVEDGLTPVAVVEADWWQAARSTGPWSLVSCCVGPGFEFADYSLLRDLPELQRPSGPLPEFV
jgi:uncharacterized protein